MDRRQALFATLASSAALAASVRAEAHAHGAGHHGGANGLLESALHCARDGEACLGHCLEAFAKGDTSLAACARSVADLVPACTALAQLAALRSAHVATLAKAVMAICKDCEENCRKHADHHDFCKACADSCAACIKACESVH